MTGQREAPLPGLGSNADGRRGPDDQTPGVATAGIERANRLQRRLAALVVGLPLVGFVVGVAQVARGSVGWLELVLFAAMYLPASLGIELGFHRFFSHRAFAAGPALTATLAILGSMAAQGPVLFWAAIHRRHHAFSDRPGDPHSPNLGGDGTWETLRAWWHSHAGWMFVAETTGFARYVPDILRDRVVFATSRFYPLWVVLGLVLPGLAGALLAPHAASGFVQGVLWGGLIRIFATDQMTWSVNSFGHLFGRRLFDAKDRSGNIAWLALPSLGGSWHNTHHAFPRAARNDIWRHQLDPSGWIVALLERAGLAWDVKTVTPEKARARQRALEGATE